MPGDAGTSFRHEAMRVHCRASAPLIRLELISKTPEVMLGSWAPRLGANATSAQAALLSTDRGASFEVIPSQFDGPPAVFSTLAAVDCSYVHGSLWATTASLQGSAGDKDLLLTIVADGRGRQLRATVADVTHAGVRFDAVWKYDATRWFLRSNDWVYVTTDAGQSVKRLRPVCWKSLPGHQLMPTVAWSADSIWFHDVADDLNNFYRRDGATAPRKVELNELPPFPSEQNRPNFHLANWGERLVTTDGPRLWVAEPPSFKTWTQLESPPSLVGKAGEITAIGSFSTDPDGNLWAVSTPPFTVLRYRPNETRPVVIDFDVSPATARALTPIQFAADGTLVFSAQLSPGRDLHEWATCEAGASITQRIDRLGTEPFDAVHSGRVVRIARLQEGNELTDRLAVSPGGVIVGGAFGSVRAHGPGAPALYTTPPLGGRVDAGVSPWAIHDADDTSVAVVRHNDPSVATGPATNLVRFDTRTGALLSLLPLPTKQVLDVDVVADQRFHRLPQRTTELASWRAPRPQDDPFDGVPSWPDFVSNGRDAVVLTSLDVFENTARPGFLSRQSAVRGRLTSPCSNAGDAGLAPGCLPMPPLAAIAARLTSDGTLYVLDRREGRVVQLDADGGTFVDVARGFLSPSDLKLRPLPDGGVALLVYDGDVFAFVPERGVVKRARANEPPAVDAFVEGARDLTDCLASGPCVAEPVVELSGLSGCVTGRSFGDTSGALVAGAAASITSWSDTRVCFTFSTSPVDDVLSVRRADGVRSNEVPFVGDGRVSSFELPSAVFSDTVLTVSGENLARATVQGATVLERGSAALKLRVENGGMQQVVVSKRGAMLVSRAVNVKPKVERGCRAPASQRCTIVGTGLGDGSGMPQVTLDGAPVTVEAWSPSSLTFRWPAGVRVGQHTLQLPNEGTAQVEVLPPTQARVVLSTDGQTTLGLSYAHGRPVETPAGVLAPVYRWALGSGVGAQLSTGLALVDQVEPSQPGKPTFAPNVNPAFLDRGAALQTAKFGDDVYVLGTSAMRTTGHLVRLTFDGGVVGPVRDVGDVAGPGNAVNPAGLGVVQGRLVMAVGSQLQPLTWLRELQGDGGPGRAQPIPRSFVTGSGDQQSVGTWFTANGVYFASCHSRSATAEVLYAPAGLDAGQLVFGPAGAVFNAGPSLEACAATDDGLLFVRGDENAETLYRHRPDAGLELITQLPTTLPGARQRQTYGSNVDLPGLLDLAELPNGDVVVLLNESVMAPKGLRLARFVKATQQWVVSPVVVPPATLAQRGEVCVGPFTSTAACPGWARWGCAPFACAVDVPEVFERDSVRIGEAELIIRGAEALVVFETTETSPLPSARGSTEVHAVTLPLP